MDSSLRAEATGTLPSTTALFLHWKAADQKKRGGGHMEQKWAAPLKPTQEATSRGSLAQKGIWQMASASQEPCWALVK